MKACNLLVLITTLFGAAELVVTALEPMPHNPAVLREDNNEYYNIEGVWSARSPNEQLGPYLAIDGINGNRYQSYETFGSSTHGYTPLGTMPIASLPPVFFSPTVPSKQHTFSSPPTIVQPLIYIPPLSSTAARLGNFLRSAFTSPYVINTGQNNGINNIAQDAVATNINTDNNSMSHLPRGDPESSPVGPASPVPPLRKPYTQSSAQMRRPTYTHSPYSIDAHMQSREDIGFPKHIKADISNAANAATQTPVSYTAQRNPASTSESPSNPTSFPSSSLRSSLDAFMPSLKPSPSNFPKDFVPRTFLDKPLPQDILNIDSNDGNNKIEEVDAADEDNSGTANNKDSATNSLSGMASSPSLNNTSNDLAVTETSSPQDPTSSYTSADDGSSALSDKGYDLREVFRTFKLLNPPPSELQPPTFPPDSNGSEKHTIVDPAATRRLIGDKSAFYKHTSSNRNQNANSGIGSSSGSNISTGSSSIIAASKGSETHRLFNPFSLSLLKSSSVSNTAITPNADDEKPPRSNSSSNAEKITDIKLVTKIKKPDDNNKQLGPYVFIKSLPLSETSSSSPPSQSSINEPLYPARQTGALDSDVRGKLISQFLRTAQLLGAYSEHINSIEGQGVTSNTSPTIDKQVHQPYYNALNASTVSLQPSLLVPTTQAPTTNKLEDQSAEHVRYTIEDTERNHDGFKHIYQSINNIKDYNTEGNSGSNSSTNSNSNHRLANTTTNDNADQSTKGSSSGTNIDGSGESSGTNSSVISTEGSNGNNDSGDPSGNKERDNGNNLSNGVKDLVRTFRNKLDEAENKVSNLNGSSHTDNFEDRSNSSIASTLKEKIVKTSTEEMLTSLFKKSRASSDSNTAATGEAPNNDVVNGEDFSSAASQLLVPASPPSPSSWTVKDSMPEPLSPALLMPGPLKSPPPLPQSSFVKSPEAHPAVQSDESPQLLSSFYNNSHGDFLGIDSHQKENIKQPSAVGDATFYAEDFMLNSPFVDNAYYSNSEFSKTIR